MPQKIDPLSRLVEDHPDIWAKDAAAMSHAPRGWYAIIDRLLTDIETELGDDIGVFRIEQLKSKYAGLRLYYSLDGRTKLSMDLNTPGQRARISERSSTQLSERLDALIDAAEQVCSRTCELCGDAGRSHNRGGWLITLCEKDARAQRADPVRNS